MKKILATTAMAVLFLSACGGNSNPLIGKWEKTDEKAAACRDYFKFEEGNKVELKSSKLQGGQTYFGTYENIGDDDYKFTFDQGSDTFRLKVDGDKMTAQISGGTTVCEYEKKTE